MQKLFGVALCWPLLALAAPAVSVERLPEGGYQPQIAQGSDGAIHVIYLKGDAAKADIYYARKGAGAADFGAGTRVNSKPGSAIGIGSIRGPHIAIGQNGRVHVAWMGSSAADQVTLGGEKTSPMLYTHLSNDGKSFEPERNVISNVGRLDGGGTVTADNNGNVYVAWHGAPAGNNEGEAGRGVYVAKSNDEGRTFAPEKKVAPLEGGVCACCGMGAFTGSNGAIFLLYRAALQMTNRDEVLLVSRDKGLNFEVANADRWNIAMCPMSGTAFTEAGRSIISAWENNGKIRFARVDNAASAKPQVFTVPGSAKKKHPASASNASGQILIAWTEGTAWNKGGSVGWQTFDPNGKPVGEAGRADGLPVWGLVGAYAKADGSFAVVF